MTVSIALNFFELCGIIQQFCGQPSHSFVFEHSTMARQKATPLRREPSSEYTQGTPGRNLRSLETERVNGDGAINGHINGKLLESRVTNVQKEAGTLQLVVAVAGIYGSL